MENYKDIYTSIIVLGASGDLARKKTYPALFELYVHNILPKHFLIMGYARSIKTNGEFQNYLKLNLLKSYPTKESDIDYFIRNCFYSYGGYDSIDDVHAMNKIVLEKEELHYNNRIQDFQEIQETLNDPQSSPSSSNVANRIFYFAIPPNVFIPIAKTIANTGFMKTTNGKNSFIIEKPFGFDYDSCFTLQTELNKLFDEDAIYRIDHYLGKEMVQNISILRFGNIFIEPIFNARYIHSVQVTFKEDFGVAGRGGYFDVYGIIRDVIQNHLMQLVSLIAMEPPVNILGTNSADNIRNAKVNVLKCIQCPTLEQCIVGQYKGYLDDETIPTDSITPTFAMMELSINNPRWEGVPFIIKAGKALESRKAEIRVQFKDVAAVGYMFPGFEFPRNELVLRLQPEAVYMKLNIKKPGLGFEPVTSELDLTYENRFPLGSNAKAFHEEEPVYNPDAYPRLLLDVLRNDQSTFVRRDELEESWRILTPLLHELMDKKVQPIIYEQGSRGPTEADQYIERLGVKKDIDTYKWKKTPCPCEA